MATPYKCQLGAVGQKRAREELGEVDTDREAAVQALREWVLAQGDWLKSPTDTQFLLGFLRHRKFSQKAAKDRLIQYWSTRKQIPEWFSNVDTNDVKLSKAIRHGMITIMPKRDKDGSLVCIWRPSLTVLGGGSSANDFNHMFNGAFFDLVLRQDMTQVCGVKGLCDFTGASVEHVMKMAESGMKKIMGTFMRSYPMRICALHYYNLGPLFELFVGLTRPFMPKKIKERVKTHTSLKTVYESIDMTVLPREYLPDDYTGNHAGPLQDIIEKNAREMEEASSRDYLLYLSSGEFYCDESERPADAVPTESFRSLQL